MDPDSEKYKFSMRFGLVILTWTELLATPKSPKGDFCRTPLGDGGKTDKQTDNH